MIKETIYLAGQISTKNLETYKWRERFIEEFKERENVDIINPCKNEFNQEIAKNQTPREEYLYQENIQLVVPKDRRAVIRSSIVVINLIPYEVEKMYLGSLFELAWTYEDMSKTVIGISPTLTRDENWGYFKALHSLENPLILSQEQMKIIDTFEHYPFINQRINTWVEDEIEAAEVIKRFFL